MNLRLLLNLNKREKFVLAVIILSLSLFIAEFYISVNIIWVGLGLAFLTDLFLFFIIRHDIKLSSSYPIFILPFFYTLAFSLFYTLVPERLISRLVITSLYAFGLYSLFLSENIFIVSAIRTINLLRSARIVSFVITILVLFFMVNFIFSLRLPIYITPFLTAVVIFFLNYQSLWTYSLEKQMLREILLYSIIISLAMFELSLGLSIWPVDAQIYSLFVTGIFYMYSGLLHYWIEKRLFGGILWEYIWVGVLSFLVLIFFSR